jgi:LysM repeat protein
MYLRKTLGWLIPIMFSWSVLADDIKLNPTHPEQYVVVEGDTLWGIAEKFLLRPGQWPRIWHTNPQINNPNLIYPGDVLAFSGGAVKPQVGILNRGVILSRYEKWSPKVRESPIQEAIKLIPTHAINQFLSSPKVVNQHELEEAPYVLEFAGEHLIVGAGDKVYARRIKDVENTQFIIYRKGDPYISPENGEILGYEATYVADARLLKSGDPATLVISKASNEIRAGDRLMPVSEMQITLNYFPRPPEKPVSGRIISVLNGVSQIGQYNIVVIDKGLADGLAIGHVLDIFQKGRLVKDPYGDDKSIPVALPDELSGSLMVFRPFERVSYALVMQANQSIHVLDRVETP